MVEVRYMFIHHNCVQVILFWINTQCLRVKGDTFISRHPSFTRGAGSSGFCGSFDGNINFPRCSSSWSLMEVAKQRLNFIFLHFPVER